MYIRTKDGVYDTSKGIYTPSIKMWAIGTVTIYDDDILKQADTIDELCDELVIHRKEHNYNFVWNEDRNIGLNYFCSLPEKYDVYGAVWVDGKGLIYVAKMNDKGELELI